MRRDTVDLLRKLREELVEAAEATGSPIEQEINAVRDAIADLKHKVAYDKKYNAWAQNRYTKRGAMAPINQMLKALDETDEMLAKLVEN